MTPPFPTLRNGNNNYMWSRNYSRTMRCSFCRRFGHRFESCPIHLLSRLYRCINNERVHESICFQIIRSFSIIEITGLLVAIHEERNITYSSNLLSEPFYNIVPIIATIFLDGEYAFENENIIQDNQAPVEQNHERMEVDNPGENFNLPSQATANWYTSTFRSGESLNLPSQDTANRSFSTLNTETIQQIEAVNIVDDFILTDDNPIVEMPETDEENEIIENNEYIPYEPSHTTTDHFENSNNYEENLNINNFFEERIDGWRLPPLVGMDTGNTGNTGDTSQNFIEESDQYWRLPPLVDMSGNVFSEENVILPPIGIRSEESLTNATLPPIQIILNRTIDVIPTNIYSTTEETICPICYEDFQEKNIIKTNCGHCFCFDCVTKFTKNNNTCPMCRSQIFNLNVYMENLLVGR